MSDELNDAEHVENAANLRANLAVALNLLVVCREELMSQHDVESRLAMIRRIDAWLARSDG